NEFQVNKCLGGYHPWRSPNLCVEKVEKAVVVLADHFDDGVERARGEHDVVDGFDGGQLLGHPGGVAGAADADHRLPGETQLHRIGDRHDLHDAGVDHTLDALTSGCHRQPDPIDDSLRSR